MTETAPSHLSNHDLDELRKLGHERSFGRGQRLVFEGGRMNSVLLIESGRVKIVSATVDGDEMILAIRSAGQLIGDLSAMSSGRASASVVAIDDVTVTLLLSERYLSFLEARPAVMMTQMRRLVGVLQESDAKLLELATADVERRLVNRLLDLVEHGTEDHGDHVELLTNVSQEELAGMCGASREAIARVLRQLRQSGVIRTDRRRILIADIDALRAMS